MRCRLTLLAFAIALAVAGAALGAHKRSARVHVAQVTSTTFVLTGHGNGHGVGMGQWGAYGMAKGGATYDKILGFYYPGTQLGQSPVKSVRVLLAETSKATVTSTAPFRLRDGKGKVYTVKSGTVTVDPTLTMQLSPATPAQALAGPVTLLPGRAPLSYRQPYRGQIQLQVVSGRLQVVNVVGLDDYVKGVVTGESPKDWPAAALQAQAVASRSYAVATLGAGRLLYTDQRSQVYGGIGNESTTGVQAVTKTKGQVLLYDGKVATTFFSSSSGGRTTAITDLVPGAKPVSYLVAEADPYDRASPWHNWGPVVFTGGQMSKAFGVPGITDVTPVPAVGHARQLVVTTTDGAQKTLGSTSSLMRGSLGLRSTMVTFGLLSISRPAGNIATGATATLTGKVRGVKGTVTLEQSTGGGTWTPGPPLQLAKDGTFTVLVAVPQTTLFRLSAPGVKGQPLSVTTQVRRLQTAGGAAASASRLRARVRPRRPARLAAVVPRPRPRLRLLARPAGAAAGPGRPRRHRHRPRPSRVRGQDRVHPELRGRLGRRPDRARHLRRRRDRRRRRERPGHRGHRPVGEADRRQGRGSGPDHRPGRRGARDPLGSRSRREGDQPQPRRRPRPARLDHRHVLGRRGRGRPLRDEPRRPRRRGGRQRRRRAVDPVAVRELPVGAATRPRRGRAGPGRLHPLVLEPGRRLRRPRRAGHRDPVHVPALVSRRSVPRAPTRATPTARAPTIATVPGRRSPPRR